MKLLLVNQHYPPDEGATGRLLAQLAEALAARGHKVRVLTGRPSYARGRGLPAPQREFRSGVEVVRVALMRRREAAAGRVAHYLSFALSMLLAGLRAPRPEAILVFSATPFFGALAAVLLARARRCPLVYVVHDVQPEIAHALGLLPSRRLARWVARLEALAWGGATRLVLIGEDLCETVRRRGVDLSRVAIVRNWADPSAVRPRGGSALRRELGISEREFLVEYAGNLGHAQDLESVLEAARIVRARPAGRPIRFLFVGDGARRREIERAARAIEGVQLLPFQSPERVGEVLAAADLSVVPLRAGLSPYCVPSKIYPLLASGRAVAASVDAGSEVGRLVEDLRCGFRVDPGQPAALAREILRLAAEPDRARQLGLRGRRYAEREGSLERAVRQYEALLRDCIADSRT